MEVVEVGEVEVGEVAMAVGEVAVAVGEVAEGAYLVLRASNLACD